MKQNTKKNTKIKKNTRLRKRTYKKTTYKNHKNTINKNAKRKIGGNGGDEPPPTTRKRERKNDYVNSVNSVNNEINDNNKKAKTDNPIFN